MLARCDGFNHKELARASTIISFTLIMGFVHMVCTSGELPAKPGPETDRQTRATDDDHSAEMGIFVAETPGNGVLVMEVAPHSPADIGGVESGDYLLSIDGTKVSSPEELRKLVQAKKPGTHVEVILWRQGDSLKREITLATKSSDPAGRKPWLGVVLQSSDEPGALIELVHPRGPAKRAGLRHGDLVIQINGEKVASVKEAVAQIEKHEPQATLSIVVRREAKEETIKVTLGRASEALTGMPRFLGEEFEGLLPEELEWMSENAQLKDLVHRIQQEMSELRQELRRRLGKEGATKPNAKDESTKPEDPQIRNPAKPESKENQGASSRISSPESVAPTNDYLGQYRPYYPGRPYRYGYPPPRPYRYSYYFYRGVPYYYAYPPPHPYPYPYPYATPYYGAGVTVRVGPGVYYRNWR